ncbi:hypothetical protein LZG04_20470 [Saccharothrix sp. S26]|uniref:hypothetical protein n=1 Tax=Saccharothrix sp. S26 TaxID=2907215 RepID=UPI001F325E14|nr:hypothetical protein [Saccharothrix sp. S26]MCE6997158.1 hypothetical protein [Saccharothrix sp. S26]
MGPDITDRRWRDAREALTGAAHRFSRMLLDCREADRTAIGDWSVADTPRT